MCTENSIQLETKEIQPDGVLPRNLCFVILGRAVEPGWRLTPAKFAPFSGESSFRYTQDKDLKPRLLLNIRFRPVEVLLTLINHEDMSDFVSGMP